MGRQVLDAGYSAELLRRQDALQAEADRVVDALGLLPLLARVGRPFRIGSSVSGLMVWRDLDFTVLCPGVERAPIAELVARLTADPRTMDLHYQDETGPRNPSGQAGEARHYVVLHVADDAGHAWKIDLSLWVNEGERDELAHPERLRDRLTDETRLAILWIKDVWHRRSSYPYTVGGFEVYDAVLDHGVRTPAAFAAYLRERGLPVD